MISREFFNSKFYLSLVLCSLPLVMLRYHESQDHLALNIYTYMIPVSDLSRKSVFSAGKCLFLCFLIAPAPSQKLKHDKELHLAPILTIFALILCTAVLQTLVIDQSDIHFCEQSTKTRQRSQTSAYRKILTLLDSIC